MKTATIFDDLSSSTYTLATSNGIEFALIHNGIEYCGGAGAYLVADVEPRWAALEADPEDEYPQLEFGYDCWAHVCTLMRRVPGEKWEPVGLFLDPSGPWTDSMDGRLWVDFIERMTAGDLVPIQYMLRGTAGSFKRADAVKALHYISLSGLSSGDRSTSTRLEITGTVQLESAHSHDGELTQGCAVLKPYASEFRNLRLSDASGDWGWTSTAIIRTAKRLAVEDSYHHEWATVLSIESHNNHWKPRERKRFASVAEELLTVVISRMRRGGANRLLGCSAINTLCFSQLIPQGRLDEAKRLLKRAIAADVGYESRNAKSNLGIVYYMQGKWLVAESLFQELLRDERVSDEARYFLWRIAKKRADDMQASLSEDFDVEGYAALKLADI